MNIPFFGIHIEVNPEIEDHDREVVYKGVVLKLPNKQNFSFRVVQVGLRGTKMHYHKQSAETYVLLSGKLYVYIGNTNSCKILSRPGDSLKVDKEVIHRVRAHQSKTAWCLIVSSPSMCRDDYYVSDQYLPQG